MYPMRLTEHHVLLVFIPYSVHPDLVGPRRTEESYLTNKGIFYMILKSNANNYNRRKKHTLTKIERHGVPQERLNIWQLWSPVQGYPCLNEHY